MAKKVKGQKSNKQTAAQIARRELVAKYYKRGYPERRIRAMVMDELSLARYSSQTVHADVQAIKRMWREEVIGDVDELLRVELKRIDDIIVELWEAWDKSKTDYKSKYKKQKGQIETPKEEDKRDRLEVMRASVRNIEQGEKEEICFGDPRYLAEIGKQLAERRKLLGLYAPEKKDINGEFSFLGFLMETNTRRDDSSR